MYAILPAGPNTVPPRPTMHPSERVLVLDLQAARAKRDKEEAAKRQQQAFIAERRRDRDPEYALYHKRDRGPWAPIHHDYGPEAA